MNFNCYIFDILDFYGGSVYIPIVLFTVNRFVVFIVIIIIIIILFHAFITNVMRIWSFLRIPAQYK